MDSPRNLSQLRTLQRQYFQLVEPHQLRWPDDEVLKSSAVQSWLFVNLFDPDTIKSPPPDRYQLRILKLLISKLERAINDPEEDVCYLSPCDDLHCDISRRATSAQLLHPLANHVPLFGSGNIR